MWLVRIPRRELAPLLEAGRSDVMPLGRPIEAFELQRLELSADIGLLWREQPNAQSMAQPQSVLVSKPTTKDFLAWTATYVPFRPFTAFFRLADPEIIGELLEPSRPSIDRWRLPMLGLILAEGLSRQDARDSEANAYRACMAGCSYSLARAGSAGLLARHLEDTATLWRLAHSVRTEPDKRLEQIIWPWLALSELMGMPTPHHDPLSDAVIDTCRRVAEEGEAPARHLRALGTSVGLASHELDTVEAKGIPREGRVVEIEKLTHRLSARAWAEPDARRTASFLLGYAVSRVAPGTLDHIDLLKSAAAIFPAVRLWYGLVAGLTPNSTVLRFGNGFALRIHREAFRQDGFWNAPTADVAVEELQMLRAGGANFLGSLGRYSDSGTLAVELFPSVSTFIESPSLKGRGELFPDRANLDEIRRLVSDLGNTLAHAAQAQMRLDRAIGPIEREVHYGRSPQTKWPKKKARR